MATPTEPTTQHVEAQGIRYLVRTVGKGKPLLLLHGFPETGWSYAHNWDALAAAGHRVFIPDLKGYGGSDKPAPGTPGGDYRVRTLAAEIAALIRALGHDSMDVVGHDWGGIILAAMLLECPEVIDRAVVLNAPCRRFVPWKPRHVYFFNCPALPERRFWKNPTGFVRGILDHWSHDASVFTVDDVRRYVRSFQEGRGIGCALAYYRSLRAELPFFIRVQLPGWRPDHDPPKTLIVWGVHDPILPTSVGQMAHQDLAGSELVLIEDAGHFVHRESPETVNRAIVDFLAKPSDA